MSWTLYAFAKFPEWQERCRAEVDEVLVDNSEPEYNQLVELKTLEMFIKETMRMWPPVPLIGRVNATEMKTVRRLNQKKKQYIHTFLFYFNFFPSLIFC